MQHMVEHKLIHIFLEIRLILSFHSLVNDCSPKGLQLDGQSTWENKMKAVFIIYIERGGTGKGMEWFEPITSTPAVLVNTTHPLQLLISFDPAFAINLAPAREGWTPSEGTSKRPLLYSILCQICSGNGTHFAFLNSLHNFWHAACKLETQINFRSLTAVHPSLRKAHIK